MAFNRQSPSGLHARGIQISRAIVQGGLLFSSGAGLSAAEQSVRINARVYCTVLTLFLFTLFLLTLFLVPQSQRFIMQRTKRLKFQYPT